MRTRLVAVAIAAMAIIGLLWFVWRPRAEDQNDLSGYVEGEALYLAAPVSGLVTDIAVVRGQRVDAGVLLFTVDPRSISAQRDQAVGQLAQAQAQIAAAGASHAQLQAAVDAARANAAEAQIEAARMTASSPLSPVAGRSTRRPLSLSSSVTARASCTRTT
jgi:HlyD family secretion protein